MLRIHHIKTASRTLNDKKHNPRLTYPAACSSHGVASSSSLLPEPTDLQAAQCSFEPIGTRSRTSF